MSDIVSGKMLVLLGFLFGFVVDYLVGLFVARVLLQHVVLPGFQQQ